MSYLPHKIYWKEKKTKNTMNSIFGILIFCINDLLNWILDEILNFILKQVIFSLLQLLIHLSSLFSDCQNFLSWNPLGQIFQTSLEMTNVLVVTLSVGVNSPKWIWNYRTLLKVINKFSWGYFVILQTQLFIRNKVAWNNTHTGKQVFT